MTSLADEIVSALPSLVQPYAKGLTAKELSAHFCCPEAHVRAAFDEIKTEWRAQVVRHGERGGLRRLVPLGHDFGLPGHRAKACRLCEKLYSSQNEFYCSKTCSASDRWNRPGYRERVGAAISKAQKTPEQLARNAAHNTRRWSKPGEREKLAEQNRREWADPVKRAKRSAGIQAAHGTPEKRKFYSDLRKANWSDPEYYRAMQKKMVDAKNTPEFRAKFGENLRKRWQDPEQRPKFIAAVKRNSIKGAARMSAQWADPEQRPALLERQRANAARARKTKLDGPPSALAQAVLDVLHTAPGAMTRIQIERATGQSLAQVGSSLRVLERHGLIARRECGPEHSRKPGDGSGSQPKYAWEANTKTDAKIDRKIDKART